MGDLGHTLPPVSNCRKRKADADEEPIPQDTPAPTDDILVEGIPRQPPSSPWLSTDTARAVWPAESSPTDSAPPSPLSSTDGADSPLRSPKRPRVDTAPPKTLRVSERHSSPRSPTRRSRRRPDTREVSTPLPLDSQLPPIHHPAFPHIDLSSPHIPSLHPLINRQTLKELDLAAILRNPQLRTPSPSLF